MISEGKPEGYVRTLAHGPAGYAAVIGDLVASRRAEERTRLHGGVAASLDAVNRDLGSIQPLTPTLGDEFQGVYADLASALRACLLVRLRLKGLVEVRFGVGWGGIVELEADREALGQDGPAWWSAREAIEGLRETARARGGPRGRATLFRVAQSEEAADREGTRGRQASPAPDSFRGHAPRPLAPEVEPLVNALLVCRDELVARMDERDARILLGLFAGRTPSAIAEEEGISQPAISQRAGKSGAYAVVEAERLLERAAGR